MGPTGLTNISSFNCLTLTGIGHFLAGVTLSYFYETLSYRYGALSYCYYTIILVMDTFTLLWKTSTNENTRTVMEPLYWYGTYILYSIHL